MRASRSKVFDVPGIHKTRIGASTTRIGFGVYYSTTIMRNPKEQCRCMLDPEPSTLKPMDVHIC